MDLYDPFCKVENLVGIVFYFFPIDGDLIDRSVPIEILGTSREKNFLAFPIASYRFDEVAAMTFCSNE